MAANDSANRISVQRAFLGKSVLITGATGFIGKVLIEKILRDVEGVKNVYIFIRKKHGKSVKERFENFKSSPVFQKIQKFRPDLFEKLTPIEADIIDSNSLGISENDLNKLISEVSYVFHLAATVRFDEPIKVAIRTNLIGTKTLVELASKFFKLESFVYVSTAFANVHKSTIFEVIHDSDFTWQEAIQAVENSDNEKLNFLDSKSKKCFPNTYTYSKHLTEKFINEKSREMPIIILRPSIVVPNVKDPFPGWIDFRGTCMGLQIGVFYGILSCFHANNDTVLSLVPCDFVANAAIVSAALMTQSENKSLRIYNCTPDATKRTVGDLKSVFIKNATQNCPSEKVIYYPRATTYKNYALFVAAFTLLEMVPAIFYDLLMWMSAREFKFTNIQYKVFKSIVELKFFTFNETRFDDTECMKLSRALREDERSIFEFGDVKVEKHEYDRNFALGVRRYLLKEDDETIPAARRKVRKLFIYDIMIKVTFYAIVMMLLAFIFKSK